MIRSPTKSTRTVTLFPHHTLVRSGLSMWIAIAALGTSSLRFVMLIGELNFAVAAFYGIGAYAAGVGATLFELPFAVSLLLSGLLAGAVSVVFGLCTLQTRGPYFLLVGFAFTEVMRIIYTKSDCLGGHSGQTGRAHV